MNNEKRVWTAPGLKEQFSSVPELEYLIKDFIEFKKGVLVFNDESRYINAKYLIGRDVPYDTPPLKLDDLYHVHAIEKGTKEYNNAKRRHNFNDQYRWTSNYALVYATICHEDHLPDEQKTTFGIFDFWLDAHSHFNRNEKWRLEELMKTFESAVSSGSVETW